MTFAAASLAIAAANPPVPRAEANSKPADEELVAKAKRGGIDRSFAGDSITRRWGRSDAHYADMLATWKARRATRSRHDGRKRTPKIGISLPG